MAKKHITNCFCLGISQHSLSHLMNVERTGTILKEKNTAPKPASSGAAVALTLVGAAAVSDEAERHCFGGKPELS
jgi:hypothetical protein